VNDLPLNALRAFAAVYRDGGVRAAAREMGVAHSSVSRHLTGLERWLGVALVEPGSGSGRRAIAFTPQGETLGRAVLAGFRDLSDAATALREAKPADSVTLSATPSFASRWLLPRLPVLEAGYPRIELSVVVERRMADPADSGPDLAIRIGSGPWPGLHCEALMDDFLYPVMSPAYWERNRRPAQPAELVRLRLLHDCDPDASWGLWKRIHGPEELDVQRGSRFSSTDFLLHAAAQGHGVALARHRLVEEALDSGRLVRPFGKLQVELGTSYWLVRAAGRAPRPAAAVVIGWLKEQARRV
jgi:LysR family transcriptional regulator, glycine cleavage system transcriptional activator